MTCFFPKKRLQKAKTIFHNLKKTDPKIKQRFHSTDNQTFVKQKSMQQKIIRKKSSRWRTISKKVYFCAIKKGTLP